jgi:hypothetical protein
MRLKVLPLLALVLPAFAQGGSLPVRETASKLPLKESLSYSIEWRLITAGKALLQWNRTERSSDPGWHVNMHVESVGLVSKLFRVEDDYSANLNDALCPDAVNITAREGSRQRSTAITFDYEGGRASYLERDNSKNAVILSKQTDIPTRVHDVVGGLYYLRTLDLEPGQAAEVPITDGKKSVVAKVEAQRREDIKTLAGTFKTIRYEAYLFNNVLYRRPAHLNVWLTDDARKLPVQIRVRMQFTIGTITLQLEKYE